MRQGFIPDSATVNKEVLGCLLDKIRLKFSERNGRLRTVYLGETDAYIAEVIRQS